MNIKSIKIFVSFLILLVALSSCASDGRSLLGKNKGKPFKHDAPLIKEDIKKMGREEVNKTIDMGPQPIFGDVEKLGREKKYHPKMLEIIYLFLMNLFS